MSKIERKRELRQLIEAASGDNDLYEEALYLATVDDLTGLRNRRYFMMRFQEEIERGVRYNTPFGLMFLDLDDFKSVNDLHGHAVGDQVLCEFSVLLQKELRSVDVISRYGGEEFAVLLPECDVLPAHLAASRLQKLVEAHKFTPSRLSLTVSIAVAAYPRHGNNADLLLENLDKTLYQAKKHGKNMVCESDWTDSELAEKETVEPVQERTWAAMEEELQELPEVIDVQIITDEQGKLLLAEEQVTLSSLERAQALEQNNEARVVLDAISTKREADMIETEVRLDYRGRKHVGRQRGADINPSRMRVVGEATLKALQTVLPPEFKLIVASARRVTIEEAEALVVLVTVLGYDRELRFVGTALNESGDEIQSAVKAVLAALNRFVARCLSV